jgi:signal transduction histidine kinase
MGVTGYNVMNATLARPGAGWQRWKQMPAAHVSDDSKLPSEPAFDMLSPLDVWQAVTEARSLPGAATTVARLIAQICPCDSATLFIDPQGSPPHSWPDGSTLPGELGAALRQRAAGVGPIILTEPIGFSVEESAGGSWIPGAAIVLPLADDREAVGHALLCWKQAPETLPAQERLLAMGRYAAQGLRQVGGWESAERRERNLALASAVITVIGRARTAPEMLEAALDRILDGLQHEDGAIYLVDEDPSRLTLAAAAGNSPPGWPSAGPGWPHTLPDASGWAPCEFPPATHAARLASPEKPWLVALMASPDSMMGLICLASDHRHEARDAEEQLLRTLGFLLGMATEHLRMHEALERELGRRNARWAALVEISAALSQASDSNTLLDEIVRQSIQILGARGGALTLRDAASDDQVVTAVRSSNPRLSDMVGKRLKPGEGLSGQAILGRRPIILDTYDEWPQSIPGLRENIRYAALAAPLLSDGRAIGSLTVSDDTPGRRFTQDDAQTLSLFAQQAAVVLEGAHHRQQEGVIALNAERARLARDLHDGLAQDLAALLLRADACQARLGAGDEALRDGLEAISVGLQRVIRDARATIFALRPSDSEGIRLEDGLRAQAARFEAQTGVPVAFSMTGADCLPLTQECELALLRVTQEALANIRKHAQAGHVSVQLTRQGKETVKLSIDDDGRGFGPGVVGRVEGAESEHLGLAQLRQQVEALAGILSVKSGPDQGTTVCAVLPVRGRGEGRGQDPHPDRR